MELQYEKFGQYIRDILQYLNYKYDLNYDKSMDFIKNKYKIESVDDVPDKHKKIILKWLLDLDSDTQALADLISHIEKRPAIVKINPDENDQTEMELESLFITNFIKRNFNQYGKQRISQSILYKCYKQYAREHGWEHLIRSAYFFNQSMERELNGIQKKKTVCDLTGFHRNAWFGIAKTNAITGLYGRMLQFEEFGTEYDHSSPESFKGLDSPPLIETHKRIINPPDTAQPAFRREDPNKPDKSDSKSEDDLFESSPDYSYWFSKEDQKRVIKRIGNGKIPLIVSYDEESLRFYVYSDEEHPQVVGMGRSIIMALSNLLEVSEQYQRLEKNNGEKFITSYKWKGLD